MIKGSELLDCVVSSAEFQIHVEDEEDDEVEKVEEDAEEDEVRRVWS